LTSSHYKQKQNTKHRIVQATNRLVLDISYLYGTASGSLILIIGAYRIILKCGWHKHLLSDYQTPEPVRSYLQQPAIMPSIGPGLPPHFAKRKRSIDDHESPNSPPRKVQAATAPSFVGPPSKNPDELDLEDDSDDDYGPSVPTTKAARPPPNRIVGPALPPSHNPDELDLEDDSSDDGYGPSKPTTTDQSVPKRVLGPAPPPANVSEMPLHPADDSDDSDDDYGPSLPPAPGTAAHTAFLSAQRVAAEKRTSSTATAKPQRAEWMLAPPSSGDWTGRVDPTKLKNRKFASGKGAKAPAEKSGISAIWTETPEEKLRRLEDEVLGRKDAATSSSKPKPGSGLDKEEAATARRIQEYNDRNRSKSLYDERAERKEKEGKKEEEDDPSKRGFDREKDMALGGRLGHGQKKEMLAKAADFGTRFQKGRYL
jgi:hypothetical protein